MDTDDVDPLLSDAEYSGELRVVASGEGASITTSLPVAPRRQPQ
ncbi:MAG: hypothetical protein ACLR17_12425 [Enterobacteriaceae bacterium]